MRRKLPSVFITFFLMNIFLIAGFKSAIAYPNGAPAGYTGSPFDNKNCTNCHGGSASTVTGWITSNVPAQGYTAGQSYTITMTATGSGNKGFEISPMNAAGTLLGSITPGSGTKIVSTKYLTQSSAVGGSSATWTWTWTAPAAGTGSVTFYCSFAVTKPVTKLCTMTVGEFLPLGVTVTANPNTINSGQSSQLNAAAVGGSGTYTYSWTSNPAGFTSTLQNPVVYPTTTTTYTCTVNDGTNNASGNTTVTVNIPAPLNVIASATPSSITNGQSSQLNVAVTGGSGNYTFSWVSNPAGFTSGQQNPVVWPTVTTKYVVTVNDGSQTKKDSTIVTVTLAPLTATVTATPAFICSGDNSQLNVVASGGSGSYTYLWSSVPPGFTSNLQNPIVSPVVTTKFIVHTSDGTLSRNDTTKVTVTQPVTAYAGNDTTYSVALAQIPVDGFATFYSTVNWTTSGTGTFTAPYSLNGFYIPSAADKTTGSVTLTLMAQPITPCTTPVTSNQHITFSPVGIADHSSQNSIFRITPNPSAGLFTLVIKTAVSSSIKVSISDIHGIELITREAGSFMEEPLAFDLSSYPKGIYFVRIQSGSLVENQKVIVK